MDLMLIDLLESSKAIGLCPMGKVVQTVNVRSRLPFQFRSGNILRKTGVKIETDELPLL